MTGPRRAKDVFSREEIRALTRKSDLHGLLAVVVSWSLIAASFALVAWRPNLATVLVALTLLGGRQLGLAILMHEAAHGTLFRNPRLNAFVGQWLCAAPVWQRLDDYRAHHLRHHGHTQQPEDPDLGLSRGFPISPASLARKCARDLVGLTGLRRVGALVLMDLGYLEYTASNQATRVDRSTITAATIARSLLRNFLPVLATNVALWLVLRATGHGWLIALWIGAYLTTFSLFARVRSIAEHGGLPMVDNPFVNTRTTAANLLARLTVAPHGVNYHLEHHLLPTVPIQHLPRMHAMLRDRVTDARFAGSYREVLRGVLTTGP